MKKFVPTAALALAAGLSMLSPLAAFAAPAAVVGEATAIESDGGNAVNAAVPVTITPDGKWLDAQKNQHDMGKYVVTVPTSIKFSKVGAGTQALKASYQVNIAGIIPSNSKVTAHATTDRTSAPYIFKVNQGKTEFTAKEVSNGNAGEEGGMRVLGVDSTDSFSCTQDVLNSDVVSGNVNYVFSLQQ